MVSNPQILLPTHSSEDPKAVTGTQFTWLAWRYQGCRKAATLLLCRNSHSVPRPRPEGTLAPTHSCWCLLIIGNLTSALSDSRAGSSSLYSGSRPLGMPQGIELMPGYVKPDNVNYHYYYCCYCYYISLGCNKDPFRMGSITEIQLR